MCSHSGGSVHYSITPQKKKIDSVVFAKAVSEKLASVGEICDAGFVYVFTKDGSSTYKEDSVTITGQKFTHDDRDKKTRLYPRVSLAISEFFFFFTRSEQFICKRAIKDTARQK